MPASLSCVLVGIAAEKIPSLEQLQAAEEDIRDAIKNHKGTGQFWVFGSVARGEATSSSDYDLLVEFLPGASYFNLTALEIQLSEMLGHRVDVMSSKSEGYAADHARSQAVSVDHDRSF
ncbi:nucleotidyltransferase family protein [Trueperella bialowiezensis]|uniref:Predicted nucleotidyltransferases n=1 Tax=Trueperella bialowiezensis TaxID=312285 RepID=A0A448PF12_9ACTO|nr:nucleotidyltransferase family protein [Trueperella bialowiezensis]VEI13522.1 Predicted nucleotidyltransferases [Trueperella bialowiezensis]